MTINLADALVNLGVPVDLVLARATGQLMDDVPRSVRVVDLEARGPVNAIRSLASYLARRQPAGLIARMQHVNVAAAMAHWLAQSTARLVLTEATHGTLLAQEGRLARRLRYRWLLSPMTGWAYRRADALVAVSHGVAADLAQRLAVPAASLRVISNPVITDRIADLAACEPSHLWLRDVQSPESRAKSRSGSPGTADGAARSKSPLVLAVGGLREAKDFATLMRAFAILRQGMAARLIILGEGPQRQRLERLRAELGLAHCVQLPGFDANPYAAMARASLLVLSSRREGSPNVLVEALACGCPVVATDCPCGPAEILASGRVGLLAPVGDAPALASAMRESLLRTWDVEPLRRRARAYDSRTAALRYLHLVGVRPPHAMPHASEPRVAA